MYQWQWSAPPLGQDVSALEMTPLPSLAPMDPLAAPSTMGSTARDRAPAVADVDLLMHQLRDPFHRFDLEHMRQMLALLSQAASDLRAQFPLPSMVWCSSQGQARRTDGGEGPCLLVGTVTTEHGQELHAAVLMGPIQGPCLLPAHLPPAHRFKCPPNDIFDVVVKTLENAQLWAAPVTEGPRPWGGSGAGRVLRLALADWLETTQSRRPLRDPSPRAVQAPPSSWAGAVPTVPIAPIAPVESVGPVTPLASIVPPVSPMSPEPPVPPMSPASAEASPGSSSPVLSPLLKRQRLSVPTAGCSRSPATPPPQAQALPRALSPLPASPLVTEALSLATTLREGGWNIALERLAPQLLARLSPDHPLHLRKVMILPDDGQVLQFGAEEASTPARQIEWDREASEARVTSTPGSEDFFFVSGQNAYLAALLVEGLQAVPRAQLLLADLIEQHPELAALSLAIFKRWPGRDPEVMLRFCLHGTRLLPAGRQLLHAPPELRDMTAQDIAQWKMPPGLLDCSTEFLEEQGICIADAHWQLSPMGASSHGVEMLKAARLPIPLLNRAQERCGWEALEGAYAGLRYEFGSMDALAKYLRQSPLEVMKKVSRGRHAEGYLYREAMKRESVLTTAEPIRDQPGT